MLRSLGAVGIEYRYKISHGLPGTGYHSPILTFSIVDNWNLVKTILGYSI